MSGGFKSGGHGSHSTHLLVEVSQSVNGCLSHNSVTGCVRGGPILLKPLFISSDGPVLAQCCPKCPKHHCCVIDNFVWCLQVCLQCQGGHLEQILERTLKLDYFTYKVKACGMIMHKQVNGHQIWSNLLKTCISYYYYSISILVVGIILCVCSVTL